MKRILIITLLGALFGCVAGGEGYSHDPSNNVLTNGVYKISVELCNHGGDSRKTFTSAQIVIADGIPREMHRVTASRGSVVFVAEIPIAELPKGAFAYDFVFQSPGRKDGRFFPTYNLPVTVRNR